jgi:Zn-finger nucleic acid-binding protein
MNLSFNKFAQDVTSRNLNNKHSSNNFAEIKVKFDNKWSRGSNDPKPNLPPSKVNVQNSNASEAKIDNHRNLQSFNIYLTKDDVVESVNDYNNDIPESVEGTYKYDFNIMDIHDMILKKFDHQKQHEILELEKKLNIQLERLKTKQNVVERKATRRVINKINEAIQNILSDRDYKTYIDKIKPILDEYSVIGTLSKIISFATRKTEQKDDDLPETPETQVKRQEIIFDFIKIAKKYIDIDLVREMREGNLCPVCNYDLDTIEINQDEGTIVCPECMNEKVAVVRSFADITRTNNSGNNYEDRANFEKVLMRYQGKQPDKPREELYVVLEDYFKTNQLPKINHGSKTVYISSDYIRNHIPLNSDGEKDGTSRPLMYKALQDTGNSKYYDHINIILNTMWGWKLDDLSHLEDQIMDDYDKSQRVYENLPKDRKSSLNSQFRLYKHLKRLGLPVQSKNFRIPTTHDILEFHENVWSKMCKELDWENI